MNTVLTLNHVLTLTDSVGIIEHCVGTVPDLDEGYATDDNARALMVCLNTKGPEKKTAARLIPLYLSFLQRASDPKGFHQDMDKNQQWIDEANVTEGFGRAMIALAQTIVLAPSDKEKKLATTLFDQQYPLIKTIHYPRVIAQIIVALRWRMKTHESPALLTNEVTHLADVLVAHYRDHSSDEWKWFEDQLTYENSRLPMALFIAYQATKNNIYLGVAKESLDFLIEELFDEEKDCFSFAGNVGWHQKHGKKSMYGQQPIEAGGMTEACVLAYEVTGEKQYLDFAKKAFAWYGGKNIKGLSLIDKKSGGIHDGLEPYGINVNEGAESILSYLLAYQTLERVK